MRVAAAQQQMFLEAGRLLVANDVPLTARLTQRIGEAGEADTVVERALDGGLLGAVVRQAVVTVTAGPVGTAFVGDVAQVRPAQGGDEDSDSLVVDFQGLRTVSQVASPGLPRIRLVQPWLGTGFDDASLVDGASEDHSFNEILTERLLLVLERPVAPADLARLGKVTVPTPPADLELSVNGVRAWFNAGPAKPSAGAAGFRADVDVTAAVAAAVASGAVPVQVTLRSSIPGKLAFQVELDYLKTHPVVFPEGIARMLEAEAEGELALSLPLPPESAEWSIHAVEVTVTATLPPVRVVPPVGPPVSGEAELALDPDHALVVRLPTGSTGQLATLAAVRLPLRVGEQGGELAGTLYADADDLPGEPVRGGALGPVQLEPGSADATAPAWVTLPLADPVEVTPGEELWLGIQPVRGSAVWPLGVAAADPALAAPLRRRAPNGIFKPLSAVDGVVTDAGVLRLAGEPPPNAPVHALAVRVDGSAEVVELTPTPEGVTASLRFATAVDGSDAVAVVDGALQLRLTARTPGRFSFGSARVAYTDDSASTSNGS
jgi:hypothetical protein